MSEHQHQWEMQVHLDGCHFYSSTYTCSCGARLETFDEREPKSDGWAGMWFRTECERCNELLDGAESMHEHDVISA